MYGGFLISPVIASTGQFLAHAPQPIQFASIIYAVFLWTFPLLSHFENNIKGTLRNAALLTMGCFPRTLGMIAMTAIPFVVLYFGQTAVLPIIIMFGIAGPGYGCAYLYNPSFKKFEPKEETADKDPDAMPEALRDEPVRDKESE